MSTTYEKANKSVLAVMRGMVEKNHPDLVEAEVEIGVLMATATEGSAVKLHGYPCAAIVRIRNLKDRVMGLPDAEIVVDAALWEEMSEDQKDALMDHECLHLEVKRDPKTKSILTDDISRPKLRMKKHDHQYGWFNVIAERHGLASQEVSQARAFADKHGQTWFGWSVPPEGAVETKPLSRAGRKAVEQGVSDMRIGAQA